MKRFLVLGVFVCLVSCVADTSDPSTMEDTAETQDEVKITPLPPIDLRTAEERQRDAEQREREAVLRKSLTAWRVYIRGQSNVVGKRR